ncbi:rhamnan synthesis F family protein [Stenotrophomonas sp. LGBM10]|uniref:rhamnan synthesis F family protein n=1 Tax=Stenotrophomonas sp. LGBM10 TaxID=3390038 RepID=UPI00398B33D0
MRLSRYLGAARRSIQRHGGGLRGLLSVLRRALQVLSAMGIGGLLGRLRTASTVRTGIVDRFDDSPLPPPVPLAQVTLRVGVMAHVFYPDLIEEFADTLAQVPVPFTLLVSVVDDATAGQVQARFARLDRVIALVVKKVENRGRDIAPLLVAFHDEILQQEVIAHLHTKKSLYTGGEQEHWRRYLLERLFGSPQRVAWILGTFQADPTLGMVYPDSYEGVDLWAHTWLSNRQACTALAARLGIELDMQRYIDFPAGSMFWARVDALRPLYDLDLRLDAFPAETGQIDGTLQHAVERLLAIVVRHRGYQLGVLPADGSLALAREGQRNVDLALQQPLAARMQMARLGARLFTVDVFDTLVTRAFLTPDGARAHLAWRALQRHGIGDFAERREAAETAQRARLGRDPTLHEIHDALSRQLGMPQVTTAVLVQMEREHERALLRSRSGVLAALPALQAPSITAFSDMYLGLPDMQAVLPADVQAAIAHWWISCETGQRKDTLATWTGIAAREGLAARQWLHVGDNEQSDIQMPQLAGQLNPVHVLRPSALLDVIPALRPLRHPAGVRADWSEQLWRGLVANRFAHLVDTAPERMRGRPRLAPEDVGYTVLGPLLLDALLSTVTTAQQHNVRAVLFLSREGHLLHQAFQRLQQVHPQARALDACYFLASRRATLLPALHAPGDAHLLLDGTFNGSLRQLLVARLGEPAVDAATETLGATLERSVFLPEMRDEASQWLQPAMPALLRLADEARQAYQAYWASQAAMEHAMVVDIGYAGTIQRNLARVAGHAVGGHYFALRARARQLPEACWASARYFDGRVAQNEDSSPILANDLLLEALLGAPCGQFNGFARVAAGGWEPRFGPVELDTTGLRILQEVHDGALAFIDDACAAVGSDIAALSLDREGVQVPLQCLAGGRWNADDWLPHLATDDSFTGRGTVAAATRPPTAG